MDRNPAFKPAAHSGKHAITGPAVDTTSGLATVWLTARMGHCQSAKSCIRILRQPTTAPCRQSRPVTNPNAATAWLFDTSAYLQMRSAEVSRHANVGRGNALPGRVHIAPPTVVGEWR
jgi:hypothetical protein